MVTHTPCQLYSVPLAELARRPAARDELLRRVNELMAQPQGLMARIAKKSVGGGLAAALGVPNLSSSKPETIKAGAAGSSSTPRNAGKSALLGPKAKGLG